CRFSGLIPHSSNLLRGTHVDSLAVSTIRRAIRTDRSRLAGFLTRQPTEKVPILFLLFPLNRPRPVRLPMRFFDVPPSLQPRVRFQRIRPRNPHARFARNRVLASRNGHERPPFQRRPF